jgi:hypothetical protein
MVDEMNRTDRMSARFWAPLAVVAALLALLVAWLMHYPW